MKLWPDEVCYKTQARVLQDLQEFGELSLTTVGQGSYFSLWCYFFLNYTFYFPTQTYLL